jgi:hypothetical protein
MLHLDLLTAHTYVSLPPSDKTYNSVFVHYHLDAGVLKKRNIPLDDMATENPDLYVLFREESEVWHTNTCSHSAMQVVNLCPISWLA